MMKTYIRYLFFISIGLTLGSCAVQYELFSDVDTEANFGSYRTYAIIHDDHGFEIGTNSMNQQRIDDAIEKEVEGIGYLSSENPDLQISWFIKVDTKLEQGIYNAYYTKWRSPRAIEVYEYQIGSLVIDIVDVHTGKVIWHGKISGKIEEEKHQIENEINKAVKAIFNSFKKDTGIKKVNGYASK